MRSTDGETQGGNLRLKSFPGRSRWLPTLGSQRGAEGFKGQRMGSAPIHNRAPPHTRKFLLFCTFAEVWDRFQYRYCLDIMLNSQEACYETKKCTAFNCPHLEVIFDFAGDS